jgi:hypothetical protein
LISTRGITSQGTTNLFEVRDSGEVAQFAVGPGGVARLNLPYSPLSVLTYAATVTVDGTKNTAIQQLILTGNCTIALSFAAVGQCIYVLLQQDAVGSRLITWPSNAVLKWPGGTRAVLSTGANALDIFRIMMIGTNLYAVIGQWMNLS